ncbi:hypothetical protein BYT27DRAFT_7114533 [Phlegmacium glaucopus]|nr:hypothetical protein BYT27DRAFT_7114533 [Phlegmacium glaucopus]
MSSFPIKSHLPLITTRVEFNFNSLPPPPQITPRRDFGAQIRHQAQYSSELHSRPRPRKKTPARAQSVEFDLQSESDLTNLSDGEDSDDVGDVQLALGPIPKPAGEAGKRNSGGFNLEREMHWPKKHFNEFKKYIKTEVAAKLNIKKCFTNQTPAQVESIIQSTAQKFGIENVYVNNWPIREALKARLKYTSDWEKKKEDRKIQAELKEVLKPFKGKGKAKEG